MAKKKTDKDNKKLCKNCTKCCEYICISIDKPTTKTAIDEIIWFLLHENIEVFIDNDNDWTVEIKTKCKALTKKNGHCKIYEQRPEVCKEHDHEECEHHNKDPYYKERFKIFVRDLVSPPKKYAKSIGERGHPLLRAL